LYKTGYSLLKAFSKILLEFTHKLMRLVGIIDSVPDDRFRSYLKKLVHRFLPPDISINHSRGVCYVTIIYKLEWATNPHFIFSDFEKNRDQYT